MVVKAFLLPVDLQISQPCKFFQPSKQKMPLLLNGLTGLWFWIRHVFFSTYFLSQKGGVRKKKKKRRERFFEDLRSSKLHVISLENMYVREDRFSLVFCVLFFFFCETTRLWGALRLRENPGHGQVSSSLAAHLAVRPSLPLAPHYDFWPSRVNH